MGVSKKPPPAPINVPKEPTTTPKNTKIIIESKINPRFHL
jgi:hypothetical protein